MAINTNNSAFARSFGAVTSAAAQSGEQAQAPKEKAKYWLNVGYVAPIVLEGETEPRFIALPVGIPLDTTKPAEIRGQNAVFNAFLSAQNDLLADLTAEAAKLEPGQSAIIGDPNAGLVLQLRRVNDAPAAVDANENLFTRRFNIVGGTDAVEDQAG